MNVKLLQVKTNPDTTVTVRLTVQIPRAVSCVSVEKDTLEMVLLVEVITYYKPLKMYNLEYGLFEKVILNISSQTFRY